MTEERSVLSHGGRLK